MRGLAAAWSLVGASVAWGLCAGARGFVLPKLTAYHRAQLSQSVRQGESQTAHDCIERASFALCLGTLSVAAGVLHVATAKPSPRRPLITSCRALKAENETPTDLEPATPDTEAPGTLVDPGLQESASEAPLSDLVEEPAAQEDASIERGKLKADLLRIAAASSRGEKASRSELDAARNATISLEVLNPTASPTLAAECSGTWELVFADTQLFRSSPFFMAGRALCREGDEAARYDWFCDMHRAALAFSNIGKVRQIISPTAIVSEFEVQVGAAPAVLGYPVNIDGAIVSTANIVTNRGDGFELLMESVEIKGSNVPLLREVLDGGLLLRTGAVGGALDSMVPDRDLFPTPLFRTTYLDTDFRISRDQDGKLFVYSRVSDATTPTNYDNVSADLGIPKLFGDALEKLFG